MSRLIFFGFIFGFVLFTFMMLYEAKDTYKILPVSEEVNPPLSQYADWTEYTAEGKFKVLLPVVPQHATESLAQPEPRVYNMYVSEMADGTIFMISQIRFLGGIERTPQNLLSDIMRDMLKSNPDNELKDVNADVFQGFHAMDFSIVSPQREMLTKAFVKGKTLYVMTMIAKNAEARRSDFETFVNSFQLLDDRQ